MNGFYFFWFFWKEKETPTSFLIAPYFFCLNLREMIPPPSGKGVGVVSFYYFSFDFMLGEGEE